MIQKVLDLISKTGQRITAQFIKRPNENECNLLLVSFVFVLFFAISFSGVSQYDKWKHSPDVSSQPPLARTCRPRPRKTSAASSDSSGLFDFSQAESRGEDIRFRPPASCWHTRSNTECRGGHAAVWVRIPTIKGNDQQAIRMHWGHDQASSESDGEGVFQTTEGFAGVWHLGDTLKDATSNNLDGFNKSDVCTTNTSGMIGDAQEFGANKILVIRPSGVGPDRRVTCMPSAMPTAQYRPGQAHQFRRPQLGSGVDRRMGELNVQKPNMGLSYFTMTGRGQP